jgi:hypothetical protein
MGWTVQLASVQAQLPPCVQAAHACQQSQVLRSVCGRLAGMRMECGWKYTTHGVDTRIQPHGACVCATSKVACALGTLGRGYPPMPRSLNPT